MRIAITSAFFTAALALAATSSHAAGPQATKAWGGLIASNDAAYLYAGAAHAWHGNLDKDDVMLRVSAGRGWFHYDSDAFPGDAVEADKLDADIMLGYQKFLTPQQRFTIYAGFDSQKTDLSPEDTNNPTRGTERGFKTQLEFVSPITAGLNFDGTLAYSTANNYYYTSLRAEAPQNGYTFGPEVVALGNESFDQQRLGGFVNFLNVKGMDIGLNAGYAWASRQHDDGAYAGVGLFKKF